MVVRPVSAMVVVRPVMMVMMRRRRRMVPAAVVVVVRRRRGRRTMPVNNRNWRNRGRRYCAEGAGAQINIGKCRGSGQESAQQGCHI